MSNYDAEFQLYCERRAIDSRETNLAVDLSKAIKEIKQDDNFWNVEWRGMTFSIKPFLYSALSFLHFEELFDILCTLTVQSGGNFYDNLIELGKKDYYGVFSEDENNVCKSILHQFGSQIPCVARYLIGLNDIKITRTIMSILVKEFTYVYANTDSYIKFKNDDICNTEAFSYFISIFWVLQKSKKLQLLLVKEIKIRNFQDLLIKLCPECSIHYKYLAGEISSKQLLKDYIYDVDDVDKTPVIYKELYNLLLRDFSEYDKDRDEDFLIEFCSNVIVGSDYEEFIRIMACSYITMGFYSENKEVVDENLSVIEDLKSSNESLYSENKQLKSSLKAISKDKDSLESDYNSLMSKSDSSKYESKIKDLNSIISELKSQVSTLESKLALKDTEVLKQKQVIRSQIKELKSLNARLEGMEQLSATIEEVQEEDEPEYSIADMADYLKNFKIGVFGGFDAGNLVEKFSDYGLEVKHIIDEKQFIVGDLDCAVILTTNVQHKTVKRLKSQYSGKYVYFSGTSIDLIIQEVFRVLCKD